MLNLDFAKCSLLIIILECKLFKIRGEWSLMLQFLEQYQPFPYSCLLRLQREIRLQEFKAQGSWNNTYGVSGVFQKIVCGRCTTAWVYQGTDNLHPLKTTEGSAFDILSLTLDIGTPAKNASDCVLVRLPAHWKVTFPNAQQHPRFPQPPWTAPWFLLTSDLESLSNWLFCQ